MTVLPGIRRAAPVAFRFDGTEVLGAPGETVLSALLAAGIRHLRDGPVDGGPRGGFCAMGTCQECLVEVAGRRVEACRTPVAQGLEVARVRP